MKPLKNINKINNYSKYMYINVLKLNKKINKYYRLLFFSVD